MRLGIVGRNPRAGGWECVIFGHIGLRSDAFAPVAEDALNGKRRGREFSAFGPWDIREMRPGAGYGGPRYHAPPPAPSSAGLNAAIVDRDRAICLMRAETG